MLLMTIVSFSLLSISIYRMLTQSSKVGCLTRNSSLAMALQMYCTIFAIILNRFDSESKVSLFICSHLRLHYWQMTNTSYHFITQGKLLHCDVKVTKSAVHWFSHFSENRNPFPNTVLVKYESWCEKMYKLHPNDQDKQVWMYVLHGHICREQKIKIKNAINVTMKYWTDHSNHRLLNLSNNKKQW